jgi:hypothetical protein
VERRDGWPLEDYIETVIAGTDVDAVMTKADGIVMRFHGACDQCSPIDQDYEPFASFRNELVRWLEESLKELRMTEAEYQLLTEIEENEK